MQLGIGVIGCLMRSSFEKEACFPISFLRLWARLINTRGMKKPCFLQRTHGKNEGFPYEIRRFLVLGIVALRKNET